MIDSIPFSNNLLLPIEEIYFSNIFNSKLNYFYSWYRPVFHLDLINHIWDKEEKFERYDKNNTEYKSLEILGIIYIQNNYIDYSINNTFIEDEKKTDIKPVIYAKDNDKIYSISLEIKNNITFNTYGIDKKISITVEESFLQNKYDFLPINPIFIPFGTKDNDSNDSIYYNEYYGDVFSMIEERDITFPYETNAYISINYDLFIPYYIKNHFRDNIWRELMEYFYHPSKINFEDENND